MVDTIVALSTPFGLSAIAKIRLSGPATKLIIQNHLSKKNPVSHHAFLSDYKSTSGKIIDRVIALFFDGEHSYTGEDSLEIDCHGNPLIIQSILEDLQGGECRLAEGGEFTKRAYLNHKMDLCQAEAVLDLIHADNENALEISQKQLQGVLSEKIFHLSNRLLFLLAEIEAHIDFVDEDLDFDGGISEKLDEILREIDEIIGNHKFRKTLLNGIPIAIIGPPNGGKSSLFNALLQTERALVSHTPGTTRDFIRERIILDGLPIHIIDTAGLRTTDDPVEQLGIHRTIENIAIADLCLLVIDQNNPQPIGTEIISQLQKKQCILVLNKNDLPQTPLQFPPELSHFPRVSISAKRGTGMDLLRTTISEKIQKNALFPQDTAIVINERHREIFQNVRTLLGSARESLVGEQSYELCASDLKFAMEALAYITGKHSSEAILEKIFSQFCIGK
ncbi:MAG: tRNA uridine-5-carboxymethylaminomethyl(34) synthesis GTPase MnmE [Puniceicoccales bacterium]|jgi:tRNA modification GTPase|nr:tRNA uridine-5-carboxymethylaminomethyl(34) synthesis GTPase MnmE [Puniceicoccales bacterium]